MIDRVKRSKTLSELKPVESILCKNPQSLLEISKASRKHSKNLQRFLEVSPVQKEVLLSNKLHDHAYE